jgi:hypothetical protein
MMESINLKGEWGEGNYLISLELFLDLCLQHTILIGLYWAAGRKRSEQKQAFRVIGTIVRGERG